MAQEFYPNFNPDDNVQTTMDEIFANVRTLRSKFSGASTPPSPVAFQWWASTTDDILYLRNVNNTAWLPIYDFSSQEILIADGQITTAKISDLARKASIVQGEDISPATCAIRATASGGGQTLISRTDVDAPRYVNSGGAWWTLFETLVYATSSGGLLRMMCEMKKNTYARFSFGGITSSNTNTVGGSVWSWTSTEAVADVASLSEGWKTFRIQAYATSWDTGDPGGIRGVAMRW